MKPTRVALGLLIAALGAAGIAYVAGAFSPAPSGVVPIAWDRDTCAQCRMHIGDPRFAAQIQTSDREVLHFDDPGCLLRYLPTVASGVGAMYFHHHREERWLTRHTVGFVRVTPTPMGYGLGASEIGSAELSFEQAQALIASQGAGSP